MPRRERPFAPAGQCQPRYGSNGRLYCGICWERKKTKQLLVGDMGEFNCNACGAKYTQRPYGMSFLITPSDAIRQEGIDLANETWARKRREMRANRTPEEREKENAERRKKRKKNHWK